MMVRGLNNANKKNQVRNFLLFQDRTQLVGHAALTDTMQDLIIDSLSAFAIAALGNNCCFNKSIAKKSVEKILSILT